MIRDPLSALAESIRQLEADLRLLENWKTPAYPRKGDPDMSIPGIEGQLIVGDDDIVYAYLNGIWAEAV